MNHESTAVGHFRAVIYFGSPSFKVYSFDVTGNTLDYIRMRVKEAFNRERPSDASDVEASVFIYRLETVEQFDLRVGASL
jgi:hypothetical protein